MGSEDGLSNPAKGGVHNQRNQFLAMALCKEKTPPIPILLLRNFPVIFKLPALTGFRTRSISNLRSGRSRSILSRAAFGNQFSGVAARTAVTVPGTGHVITNAGSFAKFPAIAPKG